MNHNKSVRYARQISLPEVGEGGQQILSNSKVLVIGAGGLGSPLLLYLAASGIGTIGIIDHDRVALSNLQRQIIYETGDIGRPKVDCAIEAIHDLNPDTTTIPYQERFGTLNADSIIKEYDIIADGSDNFETRSLINEKCLKHKKTLVSAAVNGFSGHLSTFKAYQDTKQPCYRCLYPTLPIDNGIPTCSTSGVLGSVVGQIGAWQATEIIKELLEIGTGLSGQMIIFDALSASIKKVTIPPNPNCEYCR